jgi:hypothetical protein
MKTSAAVGPIVAAMILTGGGVTAQHVVPDGATCPRCSIETRIIASFGEAAGVAALPGTPSHVGVDAKGRYWVVFRRYPVMVFDSDGRFLRSVGTMGEGPGEFVRPWRAAAAGDYMVISEQRGRVTVFDLDFEYVRSFQLSLQIRDIALLGWPDHLLVNAGHPSPDGIRFPLHLVDLTEAPPVVSLSFGPDPQGELRDYPQRLRLGFPDGPTVWSADRLRYRINKWNTAGQLLTTFVRQPSWFPGLSTGGPGRADTPPDPEIAGVTTDTTEQVWVFARVPRRNWRQVWVDFAKRFGAIPSGAREVPVGVTPRPWDLLSTVIEVIDPIQGRVIVRDEIDQYVLSVLPGAHAVIYTEPEPGFSPTLEVRALTYRR